MNSFKIFALMVLFTLFSLVTSVWAAEGKIAVIYDGNTRVNRETIQFFSAYVSRLGQDYVFISQNAKTDLKSDFDGYVLLNTGRQEGINPVISKFLKNNPNMENVVLVNLWTGTKSTTVEKLDAEENDLGLDAVSTASYWNKRSRDPHIQLLKTVLEFLISEQNIKSEVNEVRESE